LLVPLSVLETQARVAAELDPPGQPFRYSADGNRIVGTWDIADVTYQGLVTAGTIDKDYVLTVTLDEASGSYAFTERKTDSESDVSFSGGQARFGGSKQFFTGKSVGKQWGGGMALGATSHGQPGQTWSYEFETSRIKQPLFALLESAGWQPAKKGFFARLFAH
jgi:hypothetical protein